MTKSIIKKVIRPLCPQERYTYNDFGDLIQVRNADVRYNYGYTSRHELTSKIDSRLFKTLTWRYDAVGNLIAKKDYQNETTTYQYDSSNRLVALKNPAYLQVSYHYDGAGRLLNRILSNGAQTDYQYDRDNRLINLKNISANKTVVENLVYQRDSIGNITRIISTVNRKATSYTYDARYQLINVNSNTDREDRTYTYDAVGNRKTVQNSTGITFYYVYNPAGYSAPPIGNRLLAIRFGAPTGAITKQFTYDAAGRILQKQNGAGTPIYTVTYNGKGRARQINGNTFAYDANDFRINKNTSLYLLEGENLEATYDSTGVLQDKYLRGVIVDEIVNGFHYNSSDKNDWINYTFHHDHLNSITTLTGHNGSTEETTSYDAFGSPSLTIPGTGNDLLYTGREYDQETSLYYYRARYYDAEIGRFISEDPLGFVAGINFYAYVNNNPVNFNDPLGKDDFVFTPGNSTPGVEGTGSGRFSMPRMFVENSGGTRFPLGAGGVPSGGFDMIVGGNVTNFIINQAAVSNVNSVSSVSGPQVPGSNAFNFDLMSEIQNNFGAGAITDFKQFLPSQSLFVVDGIAQQNDFVGNVIFGAAMNNLGISEFQADLGAHIQSFGADNGRIFDDPRDQSAIGAGFSFPLSFGVDSGASGGFVLYPSKPNTNMLRNVYSK